MGSKGKTEMEPSWERGKGAVSSGSETKPGCPRGRWLQQRGKWWWLLSAALGCWGDTQASRVEYEGKLVQVSSMRSECRRLFGEGGLKREKNRLRRNSGHSFFSFSFLKSRVLRKSISQKGRRWSLENATGVPHWTEERGQRRVYLSPLAEMRAFSGRSSSYCGIVIALVFIAHFPWVIQITGNMLSHLYIWHLYKGGKILIFHLRTLKSRAVKGL